MSNKRVTPNANYITSLLINTGFTKGRAGALTVSCRKVELAARDNKLSLSERTMRRILEGNQVNHKSIQTLAELLGVELTELLGTKIPTLPFVVYSTRDHLPQSLRSVVIGTGSDTQPSGLNGRWSGLFEGWITRRPHDTRNIVVCERGVVTLVTDQGRVTGTITFPEHPMAAGIKSVLVLEGSAFMGLVFLKYVQEGLESLRYGSLLLELPDEHTGLILSGTFSGRDPFTSRLITGQFSLEKDK